jgi:hypothetical protein
MNTFYQVLHKISSKSDELYNFDTGRCHCEKQLKINYCRTCYDFEYKQSNDDFTTAIVKIIIDMLIMAPLKENVKTKYDYLKTVLDNVFLKNSQKLDFLNIFRKAQGHYRVLNRLAHRRKWNKSPLRIEKDLFMNTISESQHNVVTILQNNQKYLFTVNDLKTIIETSLCNTHHFYAEPLPIKNPYNNMIFDKASLYNIYFFIKRGDFVFSDIFHKYFLANFNLTYFREVNEVAIRDKYIEYESNSEDINMLYDTTIVMLHENPHTKKLVIHSGFPKKILVDVMRPYVRLYLKKTYSLDLYAKYSCEYELRQKLKEFAEYNPKFGRRFSKKTVGNQRTFIYDMDYKKFKTANSLKGFYKSHLEALDECNYSGDIFNNENPESESEDESD